MNVYRLARVLASRRTGEDLLTESEEVRKALILLLALVTGYPEEGAELVETLLETPPEGTCWEYLTELEKHAAKTVSPEDDVWSRRILDVLTPHREALKLDDITADSVYAAADLAVRFSIPSGVYTPSKRGETT